MLVFGYLDNLKAGAPLSFQNLAAKINGISNHMIVFDPHLLDLPTVKI
jgi:hypothetical protein